MAAYDSLSKLIAPARETCEPWRVVLALVMIAGGTIIFNGMLFGVLSGLPAWPQLANDLAFGTSAAAMWLMLFSFSGILLSLAVVLGLLHHRPLTSLFGAFRPLVRDFLRCLRYLTPFFGLILLLPGPSGVELIWNMSLARWLTLLPVSLLLVMLQITAEEVLFRGYLMAQLAARFRSPLVWMVLPSVLFALLHFDGETYGPNAGWVAAWSGLFALAAADVTARTGNLGAALALHLANNVFALMVSSMQGFWDGMSLFVLTFGPHDHDLVAALLPAEALMIFCSWLVVRLAIRR
ncbi:type II CAAX prenyl endopeptidase Rce1 family protein [Shimia biformata]|uniref:CPBP family glutamic-type intramembrane protease n=1 Tax=Shimia biformata TaxID=1294299 RepID=UPI001951910C|nr:CPBP family intramembrane glutamic endopeptidase [Shimia biformata]